VNVTFTISYQLENVILVRLILVHNVLNVSIAVNKLILNTIGIVLTLGIVALNTLFAIAIAPMPHNIALTLLMLSTLFSLILIMLLWGNDKR
jgi:hypothetical protein